MDAFHPIQLRTYKSRHGFTLVEIMIVVAIIAMLATIAVPNFLRARKRAQATQVLQDLRIVDAAIDQYVIEHQLSPGNPVSWAAVQPYVKNNSRLYNSQHRDVLGGDFGATFTTDMVLNVAGSTKTALSDVVPDDFWSPFIGN
jgi:prepilin-type N-terminal cleavage/methylation domain-containing protein